MPPFQQALTHLLDVLSRADAGKIGRASQDSLERLMTLTREHAPGPSASPQSRPLRQVSPAASERPTAKLKQEQPSSPASAASTAPAAAAAPQATAEAPRRKLGLAEQLRAAMAAGSKAESPATVEPNLPTPPAAPPTPTRENPTPTKEVQLEQLNESIMAAARDPRSIVLGQGSARAELIFVGAAPDPTAPTAPIAGEVGALFDKIIATMRLHKGDLYITNVLKHPAAEDVPSPGEIEAELPSLLSEIEIIGPKCIVALGEVALATLVGKTDPIDELRGEWHSFRGIPVMATFHPAYLCENESKQVRRMFWEDMLQVLELLAKPITPRQREFFK